MLLRVDVYSKDWKVRGSKENDQPPTQQLYASLASSQHDDRLLSIGRKTGDVILSSDSSVSREHSILRIVSTKGLEKTTQASTPAELAACEKDEHGLCVSLENLGKLGTYMATQITTNPSTDKDGDDSSGTDMTDDEEEVQASLRASQLEQGLVPLSEATRFLLRNKPVRMQEVTKRTLEALSEDNGRVILQCGKIGSTIVLTRIVLDIVFSKKKPAGFVAFERDSFYKMGLRESPKFDCKRTRLVVTQARSSSVKLVAAWSSQVPIVNFRYLYDYLKARKSHSDPLFPLDPKKYPPSDDNQTFWEKEANPRLLSSCTLISTKADENEELAEAVGASVKRIYEHVSTKDINACVKHAQTVLDTTPHCFGLVENRRKKLDKELEQQAELRMVNQKDFVTAILTQELPEDLEGQTIGRIANNSNPSTQTEPDKGTSRKNDRVSASSTPKDPELSEKQKITKTDNQNDDNASAEPETRSSVQKQAGPIPSNRSGNEVISKESPNLQSRRHYAVEKGPENDSNAMEHTGSSHEQPKRKSPHISHEKQNPVGDSATNEQTALEKTNQEQNQKRQKTVKPPLTKVVSNSRLELRSNKSGWFQAAPKYRNAYKRSREEIESSLGSDLTYVSVTDMRSGLIVKAAASGVRPSSRRQAVSGPDYRAFRKNHVRNDDQESFVELRAVLPREMEEQQVLEEQQEMIAESRRLADQLFSDAAEGSSRPSSRSRR